MIKSAKVEGRFILGAPKLAAAKTSSPRLIAVPEKPNQSSFSTRPPGIFGTIFAPMTKARNPIGIFTKKIQCQEAWFIRKPPSTGATTGAANAGQTEYEMTLITSPLSTLRIRINLPTGTIVAAPTPCNIRMMVNSTRFVERAQSREAIVKMKMLEKRTILTPNLSASQAETGIRTTIVTM